MLVRSRRQGVRRGVSVVETAIVISAFLMFLFAVFEYGRFVMIRNLIDNAAREGAREASIRTNSLTTTDIQNTVIARLAGQPLNSLNIQVYLADPATGNNIGSWNTAEFGEAIACEVTGDYSPMLPTFGFLPTTVNLKTKAMMRSEYID
jgi:Flp pilus assembly protein TadG